MHGIQRSACMAYSTVHALQMHSSEMVQWRRSAGTENQIAMVALDKEGGVASNLLGDTKQPMHCARVYM